MEIEIFLIVGHNSVSYPCPTHLCGSSDYVIQPYKATDLLYSRLLLSSMPIISNPWE